MIPYGAIPEDERQELARNYNEITPGYGYFLVSNSSTELWIGNAKNRFCFTYRPAQGYYFRNYFHAWAYRLKLLEKLKTKSK